jgi:NADH:ubiquinone oxidoreductase subunit
MSGFLAKLDIVRRRRHKQAIGLRWQLYPTLGADRFYPMGVKTFFLKVFTWWNGSTFGMDMFTRRRGERVGEDEQGNVYYRSRNGQKDKALGHERRWVIYKGEAEASRIPPGWAGWLAFTYDVPPAKEEYRPREWQTGHQPNMTGTAFAYRPKGSALGSGKRQPTGGDYKAWTPNN